MGRAGCDLLFHCTVKVVVLLLVVGSICVALMFWIRVVVGSMFRYM